MNIILTDTWDTVPQTIYTNLSKSDIILLENNNMIEVHDITNNIPLFETSKYINHIIVDNNMIYIYKKKIKCMYSKKYITFDMIAYIENISNKKIIKLNITNERLEEYYFVIKSEYKKLNIPKKISKYVVKKLYDDNILHLGIYCNNNINIIPLKENIISNYFKNL